MLSTARKLEAINQAKGLFLGGPGAVSQRLNWQECLLVVFLAVGPWHISVVRSESERDSQLEEDRWRITRLPKAATSNIRNPLTTSGFPSWNLIYILNTQYMRP